MLRMYFVHVLYTVCSYESSCVLARPISLPVRQVLPVNERVWLTKMSDKKSTGHRKSKSLFTLSRLVTEYYYLAREYYRQLYYYTSHINLHFFSHIIFYFFHTLLHIYINTSISYIVFWQKLRIHRKCM